MIYTYEDRVRYSEIDENARMTLLSLINNMQDCCTFHGEDVGVGLRHNMERGHGWVVTDLQMQIDRYPMFGERILVTTWASGFRGMIAQRNFSIETEDHELLAEAATQWVLIDIASHRPIRIPQEQEAFGIHPEKKLTRDLGGRKIRLPEEMREMPSFEIREDHLDTNRHVNNAQYVRFAMRYFPEGFTPETMRVAFKRQAMLGDVIVPHIHVDKQEEDTVVVVSLADRTGESFFVGEWHAAAR